MGLDPELLKQLIHTFKAELEEQGQFITTGLLQLEKGIQDNEEREKTITSIFRAAHNIKGSSRSLGINSVGEISHHIESLFSSIQKKTIEINPSLIDLCLEAVDKMQSAMNSFVDQAPLDFDFNELIDKLNKGQLGKKLEPSSSENKQDSPTEQARELKNQHNSIRVSINNMDHISALMEEMQVNKIAIDYHYSELEKLTTKIKQFQKIWDQILSFPKNSNEQALYHTGEDYFIEISNDANHLYKNMRSRINELSRLSNSLQNEIRLLRLVPIANLLCTMPRYVRDLSHTLNKKVELIIQGDEVKIDKMVLEKLKDPLIHILRNCIDHGIETEELRRSKGKPEIGKLLLRVKEENNRIHITISDDGAGIDIKKIAEIAVSKNMISPSELKIMSDKQILDLIFKPGFSSKEIITHISGRGIGLDIVKTNITNLNGQVTIETQQGKGTTFDLDVPLTLSSEYGLLVTDANQLFVISINAIERVLILSANEIFNVEGHQAIMLNDHPIPLYSLANILHLEKATPLSDRLSIVIIKKGWHLIAVVVDEIIGEREIVIKPLQDPLTHIACVAGGTLLGGNQVIPVLNAHELINITLHTTITHRMAAQEKISKPEQRPHILVVDDSITTRSLEKNILESKHYQVTVAVNGKEAWDLLQKQSFSLMITDVNMPIMDGFTLTEQVKTSEKLHDLPVIIVTSLGSDAEKKRGIEVGADAYVVKSEFESGTLLEIVEQLV